MTDPSMCLDIQTWLDSTIELLQTVETMLLKYY